MAGPYDVRRIADSVHGTVGLSRVEADVVDTASFQRLRNIKQLGLAAYVFPGADYSRFSHCIGVCHVTGLILESLRRNVPSLTISDAEVQKYRLAGLLHDIGHYPFSHAMEDAVREHYVGSTLLSSARSHVAPKKPHQRPNSITAFLGHEAVGARVLRQDKQLSAVFKRNRLDPDEISGIFTRLGDQRFKNLVSSDLDADRLDYLLRTARHSGLPYGSVDLQYLLTQMRVDAKGYVCLTQKAVRAAEHMLLCRYFDYQQVAYHKSVVGFELLLKSALRKLLAKKYIDCSPEGVVKRIASGAWNELDDALVWNALRAYYRKSDDPIAAAILHRTPVALVYERQEIFQTGGESPAAANHNIFLDHVDSWSKKWKIDKAHWFEWNPDPITLTKVGSRFTLSDVAERSDATKDKLEQAIRILDADGKKSAPIMLQQKSLLNILSNLALSYHRIYALLGPHKARRPSISTGIQKAFGTSGAS